LDCLPGNGRSPDRLFLRFPFRKFPRRWMNGGRRQSRLPLLHCLGVDGGRGGILVLLLDPRDLVVLAGLSRHRGRYLSHLYLHVKKSLMARILQRSAMFHYGVIARSNLAQFPSWFAIRFPSSAGGLRSRGGVRSRHPLDAPRDLLGRREIRTCI